MSKIGIGIIGGGGISHVHLTALAAREDAQIVGVADIVEERARQQAERYGAERAVVNYRDLLADGRVDAVVVCLPTFLHAEATIAAAQAGKHILCEKPIALTLADAQAMIDAAAQAGVHLMIAFVRRFCAEWLRLRQAIQEGVIGRPVIWRGANASSGPAQRWFHDAEKGGGPFVDGCIHDFDFALYTFGRPAEAYASLKTFKADSTSLDTGTALVRFESGDELMRSWSWGLPGYGSGCHGDSLHDVIGPRGTILWTGKFDEATGLDALIHCDEQGREHRLEYKHESGQDWFNAQMDHFLTCVREDRTPGVTGEDGREALKVSLAVLESARTGRPVKIG